MHRGQPFIVDPQAIELVQPGDAALHYLPGLGRIAAMPDASLGDLASEFSSLQCMPMHLAVATATGRGRRAL
jgi:hypothetical protein